MKRAFLVGFLSKETGHLHSVGLYSSETVTGSGKFFQVTILSGYGSTYVEGIKHLRDVVRDEAWLWLHRFMDSRTRNDLGVVS